MLVNNIATAFKLFLLLFNASIVYCFVKLFYTNSKTKNSIELFPFIYSFNPNTATSVISFVTGVDKSNGSDVPTITQYLNS